MSSAKAIQHVQHCPKCDSPAPHLHPAIQFEGEVQPCNHAFHFQITPQNTQSNLARDKALLGSIQTPTMAKAPNQKENSNEFTYLFRNAN